MEEAGKARERYTTCHICKEVYPVESVAMLCCRDDKTWEDDGEWYYLLLDGNFIRANL